MDVGTHGCFFTVSVDSNMPANASGIYPETGKSELRQYWIFQAAGWGLITLLNLSFVIFYQSSETPKLVLIYVASGISGLCLSHIWRAFLLKYEPLPMWFKHGLGPFLLGCIQLLFATLAYAIVRPKGTFKNFDWLPQATIFWVMTFVAWTIIYVYIKANRRARQHALEKLRLENTIKDAELRALQAQVNPHFFFNSLNSIRALIYIDTDGAAQVIDQMACMMRYTLQMGQSETVALADELEAVRTYLAIEKIRFEERLDYTEILQAGLSEYKIPPLIIQSLIENAIKHGVEKSAGTCKVSLHIHAEKTCLQINVWNQGKLLSDSTSTQIGLQNIRKRLALLFGKQASCLLKQENDSVLAQITIPRT
jgi:hypothetical protein